MILSFLIRGSSFLRPVFFIDLWNDKQIDKINRLRSLFNIFAYFVFFLILVSGNQLFAKGKLYSELPDSIRAEIRLKSYLLVDASNTEQVKKACLEKGFVAIDNRNGHSISTTELSIEQDFVPFIYNEETNIENLPENFVLIQPTMVDTYYCNKPDSLQEISMAELLLVEKGDSVLSADKMIKAWDAVCKMPNFIPVEGNNIDDILGVIDFLNSHRKIFGIVSSDEGLLAGVLIKELNGRKLNGYFSLPIQGAVKITPYKAGYHFSPDVIFSAPNNEKNMKIFRGIEYERSFELSNFFSFDNKVPDLIRSDNENLISKNVVFEKDKERGRVAYFKEAYIDAGISSRDILTSAFSITVWVKPQKLTRDNSILGKGPNFVIKIHHGNLTFTMAGIKDYISKKTIIEKDKWTHIGVVYSKIENQIKFYLNGQQTDEIDLIADYVESDHTLLIGSNLWEEFFTGRMDDVKIWERELNSEEIFMDFTNPEKSEETVNFWWFVLIMVVVGGSFILYIRKRKKVEKIIKPIDGTDPEQGKTEKVLCFGGLKIICSDGKDISYKLSPKLKQLFVLLLLHNGEGKKGIGSKKLTEVLWPGMSAASAKNTRGTNMQNLRQILDACTGITISFRDKHWILDIADGFYCDYYELEKLLIQIEHALEQKNPEADLQSFVNILKNGKFFPNMEFSWMDSYQEKFSNRIIETSLKLISRLSDTKNGKLILDLAEITSMHDELNETALKAKIKVLTLQGKHSLAKTVFESYTKLYRELYDSEYPVDYLELNRTV